MAGRRRKLKDRVPALLNLLKNGDPDEQDDAATDLWEFADERVVEPLAAIALDPQTNIVLAETCAESLADVWVNLGYYDRKLVKKMKSHLRKEVLGTFKSRRPEWHDELLAYLEAGKN